MSKKVDLHSEIIQCNALKIHESNYYNFIIKYFFLKKNCISSSMVLLVISDILGNRQSKQDATKNENILTLKILNQKWLVSATSIVRPACTSMLSNQALYYWLTNFKFSSNDNEHFKNRRWIIQFKKFSRLVHKG